MGFGGFIFAITSASKISFLETILAPEAVKSASRKCDLSPASFSTKTSKPFDVKSLVTEGDIAILDSFSVDSLGIPIVKIKVLWIFNKRLKIEKKQFQ